MPKPISITSEWHRTPAHRSCTRSQAAITRAASELAGEIGAAAIATTTDSGDTARLVARLRPKSPVLGVTSVLEVARQLTLSWGVVPTVAPNTQGASALGDAVLAELDRLQLAHRGDHVIITAGLPLGSSKSTNVIRIHQLE